MQNQEMAEFWMVSTRSGVICNIHSSGQATCSGLAQLEEGKVLLLQDNHRLPVVESLSWR